MIEASASATVIRRRPIARMTTPSSPREVPLARLQTTAPPATRQKMPMYVAAARAGQRRARAVGAADNVRIGVMSVALPDSPAAAIRGFP
jgi:hypothetical protein